MAIARQFTLWEGWQLVQKNCEGVRWEFLVSERLSVSITIEKSKGAHLETLDILRPCFVQPNELNFYKWCNFWKLGTPQEEPFMTMRNTVLYDFIFCVNKSTTLSGTHIFFVYVAHQSSASFGCLYVHPLLTHISLHVSCVNIQYCITTQIT